ncbi:MAG: alkaline phosphatase [Phycisphaeraceae bacterium]
MTHRAFVRISLFALLSIGLLLTGTTAAAAGPARNVILLIGDGMGYEQLKAASIFAHGEPGGLEMEKLPHHAEVSTYSARGPLSVTDSAAAATAIATGRLTFNTRVATGPDDERYATILQQCRDLDMRTGLVTTMWMTHATPAAFASHVASRDEHDEIARQMLTATRPNVMFGGVYPETTVNTPATAEAAGYTVVTDRAGMNALDKTQTHVIGQFGPGHLPYEYDYSTGETDRYDTAPHLSEMAVKALALLEDPEHGFFLMVEGGHIDSAGHDNNIAACVHETLEFDRTIASVMEWAEGRDDTLIVVTADHEAGGLSVIYNNGAGELPTVRWSTGGHTGAKVPAYAAGPGSEKIAGMLHFIDIHRILSEAVGIDPGERQERQWTAAEFSANERARERARQAAEDAAREQ